LHVKKEKRKIREGEADLWWRCCCRQWVKRRIGGGLVNGGSGQFLWWR